MQLLPWRAMVTTLDWLTVTIAAYRKCCKTVANQLDDTVDRRGGTGGILSVGRPQVFGALEIV